MINGHSQGRYLDEPFFEPILDRAAALNLPIYLHPTIPPRAVIDSCYAGFAADVTFALATVGWGWHINTATQALRLILRGVFDRHPSLQIVVGHMGEGAPGKPVLYFEIRRNGKPVDPLSFLPRIK